MATPAPQYASWSDIMTLCGGTNYIPNQYVNKRPGCGRLSDGWPTTGNAGEGIWQAVPPPVLLSDLAGWTPGDVRPFPVLGTPTYFSVFVRLATPGYIRTFKYVVYRGQTDDWLVPIGCQDSYSPVATWWQQALPTIEEFVAIAAAVFSGPISTLLYMVNQVISQSGILASPPTVALLMKMAEKEATNT